MIVYFPEIILYFPSLSYTLSQDRTLPVMIVYFTRSYNLPSNLWVVCKSSINSPNLFYVRSNSDPDLNLGPRPNYLGFELFLKLLYSISKIKFLKIRLEHANDCSTVIDVLQSILKMNVILLISHIKSEAKIQMDHESFTVMVSSRLPFCPRKNSKVDFQFENSRVCSRSTKNNLIFLRKCWRNLSAKIVRMWFIICHGIVSRNAKHGIYWWTLKVERSVLSLSWVISY